MHQNLAMLVSAVTREPTAHLSKSCTATQKLVAKKASATHVPGMPRATQKIFVEDECRRPRRRLGVKAFV